MRTTSTTSVMKIFPSPISPVRAAVREVSPGQAFLEVTPLRRKLADAAATPRLFTALVTAFGSLALALAAVGLVFAWRLVRRPAEDQVTSPAG